MADAALQVRFTKFAGMDRTAYQKASEPVFQTIELPLDAFAAQTQGFNSADLRAIRLRFDRTPSLVILLSKMGIDVH